MLSTPGLRDGGPNEKPRPDTFTKCWVVARAGDAYGLYLAIVVAGQIVCALGRRLQLLEIARNITKAHETVMAGLQRSLVSRVAPEIVSAVK